MGKSLIMAVSLALLAAGCSESQPINRSADIIERIEPPSSGYDDGPPNAEFGFMEAMASPSLLTMLEGGESYARAGAVSESATVVNVEESPPASQGTASLTVPDGSPSNQIAYSYGYGFRIDADAIVDLQERHIAMCAKMAAACRIIRTSQARSDSWDAYGELRMQVAADRAGSLSTDLAEPAEELGGALVSSVRDGEDLSEQIIDTEARLKSRLVLREKLTDILRGNRGSVSELVKAEAEIAKVNEEIDAARSKLENIRNRIRFSDVRIEYEPAFGDSQVGFVRPVATAFQSIGSTLGVSIAAIIYTLTGLLPVILLIMALRWVLHRFGYRLRFWKRDLRAVKSEVDATS